MHSIKERSVQAGKQALSIVSLMEQLSADV